MRHSQRLKSRTTYDANDYVTTVGRACRIVVVSETGIAVALKGGQNGLVGAWRLVLRPRCELRALVRRRARHKAQTITPKPKSRTDFREVDGLDNGFCNKVCRLAHGVMYCLR